MVESLARDLTGRARGDRLLEHDSAGADLDDRERVHVPVRIDTNDVINLICKHLYRPPAETLAINNRSRSGASEPRAAEL
jgi:hypothetical protein